MTANLVRDHLESGGQILKARDDKAPVFLESGKSAEDSAPGFRLVGSATAPWAEPKETIGTDKLRARVEPWLTALVQSEHLSLLVGSGLTHATHAIATNGALPGMSPIALDVYDAEITAEAKRAAKLAGRDAGNLEDKVRAVIELLRGLEIQAAKKPKSSPEHTQIELLKRSLEATLRSFANSILEGERRLVSAPDDRRALAFNYLVSFLMSFASRTGTRERLHLFTTNYDRYLEAGADIAGLRLVDRFVGMLAPIFRASRLDVDLHYNPPGIRGEPRYLEGVARFTKLHGSIDWLDRDSSICRFGLPFGADDATTYLAAPSLGGSDATSLMIYPNAAKDRETAAHPYVELFRDLAAAICRPNSTVVCYGYSLGDEHINRVLEDMLTIPSTHLVVISHGDPLGRIMKTYEKLGRHAQVTLLIGNHLGDLRALVDHYLPKPAIDRTTFRMAELLKARWDVRQGEGGRAGGLHAEEQVAEE